MILITGGAGFVGSSLALRLKQAFQEKKIVAFDNLKRRGSELNLARLREVGVEFIHGDIRQPGDLDVGKVEWIIECSAEPSALAGVDGSKDYLVHDTLFGIYHCLVLARIHHAGMIILMKSITGEIHGFVTVSCRDVRRCLHQKEKHLTISKMIST